MNLEKIILIKNHTRKKRHSYFLIPIRQDSRKYTLIYSDRKQIRLVVVGCWGSYGYKDIKKGEITNVGVEIFTGTTYAVIWIVW